MSMPRVSIGLPVYNGQSYLAQAIQSILDQTFQDFELIISDNASTDGTKEICLAFQAMDPRISYHRNQRNLGAAPNFNTAYRFACGEYFRWHAHDDYIEPTYLSECVRALDENPKAALCHTLVRRVDENGHEIETVAPFDQAAMSSRWRQDRFIGRTRNLRCLEVFGLMRRSAVKLEPPIGSYIAMDRVLLFDLAFSGPFVLVNKPLFVHREHSDRSVRVPLTAGRRGMEIVYDSANANKVVLSTWRYYYESLRLIFRRAHRPKVRIRLTAHLLFTVRQNWNWAMLILEPLLVVAPGAYGKARALKRWSRRPSWWRVPEWRSRLKSKQSSPRQEELL